VETHDSIQPARIPLDLGPDVHLALLDLHAGSVFLLHEVNHILRVVHFVILLGRVVNQADRLDSLARRKGVIPDDL